MMHFGKLISGALIGTVLGCGSVLAAALDINDPAEVPPSGYAGRQYVDSAGCVFVRAGSGSTTSWVARVDRNRKHLCGYTPSFAAQPPQVAVAAAPPPPRAIAAPMQTIAALTAPPASGLVARPTVPVAAAQVAAAPATPSKYVSPYVADPGAIAAPVPTIIAAATITDAATICPNLSPIAQRYMLSDGRHVVRCGPQTEDPVGFINRAGVPGLQVSGMAPTVISGATPVTVARVLAPPATVPPGYRAAWRDDRLNPNRARGTAQGEAQMAQVWTNDVPARLVTVSRVATFSSSVHATISSMSSPAAVAPAAQASGGHFVQVGSYGVAANADATRARLRALGLQVASARVARGGKPLQIIYAGPFDGSDAARAALGKLRGAGFVDAVLH